MDVTDGLEIYLVGGAVRDALLGRAVHERDYVVVGATAQAMLERGFKQIGRDFPVFLHPHTQEEYALARTERKTAPGYHGFSVHANPDVTLAQDLSRRDLTINALARNASGALIDPHGGRADLDNRILRHVSPAFAEDPVRILRLARFAARFAGLGFRIAPETMELMRTMVTAGEVDALVPERVWQEMARALAEAHPARFFEVLRATGALARLLPELDRLWGVPQPVKWHPEIDTGIHAMLVLDQAARLSPALEVRFAALCHDLGKGTTPAAILPSHHGHEQRGIALVEAVCARLRVPGACRSLALAATAHHGQIHRAAELRPQTLLELLEHLDALRRPERFEQILLVCQADSRGRPGHEHDDYHQADLLKRALTALQSLDLAAIAQTAPPGQIPQRIRAARLQVLKSLKRE